MTSVLTSKRQLAIGAAACAAIALIGCAGDGADDDAWPTVAPPSASTTAGLNLNDYFSPQGDMTHVPLSEYFRRNTFVDEDFGFRLEYSQEYSVADTIPPSLSVLAEYQISDDDFVKSFGLPATDALMIVRVADNPDALSVDAWAAAGGSETTRDKVLSTSETVVHGRRAIEVTANLEGFEADEVITYVARGDRVYSIWLKPRAENSRVAARREYDRIVASFEFIE